MRFIDCTPPRAITTPAIMISLVKITSSCFRSARFAATRHAQIYRSDGYLAKGRDLCGKGYSLSSGLLVINVKQFTNSAKQALLMLWIRRGCVAFEPILTRVRYNNFAINVLAYWFFTSQEITSCNKICFYNPTQNYSCGQHNQS